MPFQVLDDVTSGFFRLEQRVGVSQIMLLALPDDLSNISCVNKSPVQLLFLFVYFRANA